MAFGQVVFGGPDWLDGADIQILASNRFHPRSWTNGLHDSAKFMPIRLGRGMWSKSSRLAIPWDEPEAYRSLVHEWAHYALALKDEYLQATPVNPALGYGPLLVGAGQAGRLTLVIPQVSLPIRTIMATQQGTSELVAHRTSRPPAGGASYRVDEWNALRDKPEFSFLRLEKDHQPDGAWSASIVGSTSSKAPLINHRPSSRRARLRRDRGLVVSRCWARPLAIPSF
jgi:hypothetical protein